MPTKAELEEQLRQARERTDQAVQDLMDFRDRVVEKALQVAEEQDWCDDGLRSTLDDLGLDFPSPTVKGEFVVRLSFLGRPDIRFSELQERWIQSSLQGLGDLYFDSDWHDTDIRVEDITTTFEKVWD